MSRKKKFVTAAVTFSTALGIGFVMQYGDAVASRLQPEDGFTPADVMLPKEANLIASLAIPQASQALDIPIPVRLAALDDAADIMMLPEIAAPAAAPEPVCSVTMDATVLPLAMVSLAVAAPCQPNAAMSIHHQGMMFTVLTDDAGIADIFVPALAEDAFFISSFEGGDGALRWLVINFRPFFTE